MSSRSVRDRRNRDRVLAQEEMYQTMPSYGPRRGGKRRGGNWWNSISRAFEDAGSKIKNEFTNPSSVLAVGARDFGNKALNELTDPNSILRDQIIPIAANVGSVASMAVPGAGPILSGAFRAAALANQANEGAKMLGLGKRRGIKGGFFKMPKMPTFAQLQSAATQAQNAYNQAQQAYETAKQYSPMVKDALNAYGGEYGASAANALSQVGLGRRGRKGGFFKMPKMPTFSQLQAAATQAQNVYNQAQQAYETAKQYSPMVKDALNAYGGEYGASAANALSQVGLGRRGRRGGFFKMPKMPTFSQLQAAATQAQNVYNQAQQAYETAKQYSPMVKDALNAYGGEYGASAANALSQVGLGRCGGNWYLKQRKQLYGRGDSPAVNWVKQFQNALAQRKERKGGFFKMPTFAQLQSAATQAQNLYNQGQQAYQTAKQYSPMVKDALNAYGGEYGASAANALSQVGLGKKGRSSDGRSARAAIVRKVMMERGVNLPTASKIVKSEGLY